MAAMVFAVSDRVREIVAELARMRSLSRSASERARIVALSIEGVPPVEIEQRVGVAASTVWQWRKRFHDALRRIEEIEQEAASDGKALMNGVVEALADRPRSGRPPTFTAEQLAQVTRLVIEHVAESKLPVNTLVSREVAEQAVEEGIVETISPRHVRRFFPRDSVAATSV